MSDSASRDGQFITFRDVTGKTLSVHMKYIVVIVVPSRFDDQANKATVVTVNSMTEVSLGTGEKIQQYLNTIDIDKLAVTQ